jgi:predicted dithiol-disulfide oxidoreductase (DUF899 family)
MDEKPRYPNASEAYRGARDALLKEEQALIEKTKAVAAKRRSLPLGGKSTLILYSWMFGPNWDKPCMSCTSLMDGFDRTAYQVTRDAAFAAVAKAQAERIGAWAKERGWTQIELLSGFKSPFQADYNCQDAKSDDMQWPVMMVFVRRNGEIFHFWSTETMANHVDTVWPYWNLMDFTPEGRPDYDTPPQ